MTRQACILSGLALGLLLSGCVSHSAYLIEPVAEETVEAKLDGEWFSRTISDGQSIRAVELMYCPIQEGQPTVCRTAVVWTRGYSALVAGPAQMPAGGAAPPPVAAPPPAAASPATEPSGPPPLRAIGQPDAPATSPPADK